MENWRNKLQETCSSSDSLLKAYCRQVKTCTQIALKCLDKDSQKRPDIVKITEKLNEIEVGIGKLINIICKGTYWDIVVLYVKSCNEFTLLCSRRIFRISSQNFLICP